MNIDKKSNPYILSHDTIVSGFKEPVSPTQVIHELELSFPRPFILLIDGVPTGRDDWDLPVPIASTLHFIELPRGDDINPLHILAAIVLVVLVVVTHGAILGAAWGTPTLAAIGAGIVSLIGGLLINMMFAPDALERLDRPDDIFNFTAAGNQNKLGSPIPEHFGRFLCFPDYVQNPYTRIENNKQYLYFIGVIGKGEFDIENVFIDKTLASSFGELQYNIIPPGASPTLVPDLVWSSTAFNSQKLSRQWLIGTVNPAGTECTHVGVDFIFPAGLVHNHFEGNIYTWCVTYYVQMRKIDDRGVPISDWHLSLAQQRCARTIQPLRYGHKLPVPFGAGRYEVGVKTSVASTDIESGRAREFNIDLHIGGVCGYGAAHLPRTDVTMVEFRGMATDKLHGRITNKFNVVATRKLNTVTATGFSPTKVATSSIIDAIAYTITSPNGGNYSSGTLNFPELFNLRTSLATQGYFFNHRYTSRLSVMAAIKQMAQCGRSIPYLPGGTVSIIQDKAHALSTQVFSEEDYDTGSFKMQHIIKTVDSATYVEVSYINPDTWQREEVTYLEIGGSYETPAKLTLTGCTSRQHAYEIAAYMYKDDNLNRTAIEFTTGLKGHLPAPGDRLRLSVSMLDWGQSGVITSAEAGLVWLSEPVDFKTDSSGILHLTSPTGDVVSLGCQPSAHSHAVVATLLSWVKTAETHGTDATRYLFTPVSTTTLEARFIAARPSGENKIRLFCSTYNELTYEHPGIAPVASFEQGILPLLSSVHYVHLSALSVQISWTGTASKYRVEVGTTIVIDDLTVSTFTATVPTYTGTIKVTPYDAGVLSPANAVQIPFDILAPVNNLQITVNDGITLSATWSAVAGADHYVASILVGGDFLSNQVITTPSVTKQLADISNIPSSFTLRVVSVKGTAQSEPTEITVNVAAPPIPANFGLISHLTNGFILGWDEVTGASGYTLHMGTTTGFTPTAANRVALSTTLNATVSADVSGVYSHFFRIAAFSSAVGQDDFTNLLFSEIHLTVLPAPSSLSVGSTSYPEDGVNNNEGWLTLNWNAVTSAVAYRVKSLANASDNPKLTGTLLGEVVTLNHTVTGLNFTTLPINFHYAVATVGSTGDADSNLNWSLLSFSG